MADPTNISDYEPLKRSRTSKAARQEPDGDLGGVGVRFGERFFSDKPSDQSSPPTSTSTEASTRFRENWVIRHGHTISYVGLFLFTVVLYFRPYELIPALYSFTSLAFWIALCTLLIFVPTQLGLEGNLTARPREVNLVLLLVLAALISMPLALSPGEAWDMFNKEFIKAVLMFIVIVNVVRTETRLKGMLFLALAVSFFLSINAFNDYRHGRFAFEGYRITGSIGGMFGNPNDMALHLVTILPIAIALILSSRHLITKIACALCGILMIAAIVITYSRGGFIGLMCVAGISIWKFGRRRRLVVALLSLIGIIVFVVLVPGNYVTRIASIFDSALDPNGSSTARSELFKRSVIVAIANPVFGIGMGNFHVVSIREAVTHNSYTQVAAEMGFAASVIYTMFIVAPFRKLRQIATETYSIKRSSRYYYLATGLQISLIGYMVGSFFASVAYLFYVYYLVGYAVCLRRIYQADVDKRGLAAGERLSQNAL